MAMTDPLANGTILNKQYKVVRYLGKGGFGITYLVEDYYKNNFCIKELFISSGYICRRSQNGAVIVEKNNLSIYRHMKSRFEDEAKILIFLNHRAIVNVKKLFYQNNTIYYVMEYLSGETFKDYVKKKEVLGKKEVLKWLFPIFEAIKEMHNLGLYHRDIKPDNMMICNDRAVLIDFGAVKVRDEGDFGIVNRDTSQFVAITRAFAAPEQVEELKMEVDQRTDIYALGATLFYVLTGKYLYNNIQERVLQHYKVGRGYIRNLVNKYHLNDELKRVIIKCLEFKKEDRYQNIMELQVDMLDEAEKKFDMDDISDFQILSKLKQFIQSVYFDINHTIQKNWLLLRKYFSNEKRFITYTVFNINTNEEFILNYGHYTIGRDPTCSIIISSQNEFVSRKHLEITVSEEGIFLEETKRTQGSYIGRNRLVTHKNYRWDKGDTLYLADRSSAFKWKPSY